MLQLEISRQRSSHPPTHLPQDKDYILGTMLHELVHMEIGTSPTHPLKPPSSQ